MTSGSSLLRSARAFNADGGRRRESLTEPQERSCTKVIWEETDDLGLGHGTMFGHEQFPRVPLAFAVGFEWLHRPGTPVTVRVLSGPPPEITERQWPEIVAGVREGVVKHFKASDAALDVRGTTPVWAWING